MKIIVLVGDTFSRLHRLALLAAAALGGLSQGEIVSRRQEVIPSLDFLRPSLYKLPKRDGPLPKPPKKIFPGCGYYHGPIVSKQGRMLVKTAHVGSVQKTCGEKRSPQKMPGKRVRGRRNGSRK